MKPIAVTKKFKGLWLRKVFSDPPDRATTLQNLYVNEDGQLQARRGMQLPVVGGTGAWDASSPIRTGSTTSMVTGAHTRLANRFVILQEGPVGTYGEDLSNKAFFPLYSAATINYSITFVSATRFSNIRIQCGLANTALTLVWEFATPIGWLQLYTDGSLATPVAEQFATTGLKNINFAPPSVSIGYSQNWGGGVYNGYFGFAVRCRISAVGGGPVIPRSAQVRITGDPGLRHELLVSSSDLGVGAMSGQIDRWGYIPTGETRWFNVDNKAAAGLSAGVDNPFRMVSHDGVVYAVNGMEQRRIPGDPALDQDLGFPVPTGILDATAVASAAGFTGTWLYAITAVYGPEGKWGESSPQFVNSIGGVPVAGGGLGVVPTAGQDVLITPDAAWMAALVSGTVDRINIYKSKDLTGAAANAIALQPLFLHMTVTRADATSVFPVPVAPGPFLDTSAVPPTPTRHLDIRDRTPPARCRFVVFSKNRCILGGNNEFPARVWPSFLGEFEAFDQSNEFQDFTNQLSGFLTGMIEFQDWVVCFTEQSTHVLTNLDQEDWGVQTVFPQIGCVAPDSIRVAYGRLFWLGVDGVWMWDGTNPPKNISWPLRMEQCSRIVHGASRAVTYNYGYEIELLPQDRTNTYATQWPNTEFSSLYVKYFFSVRSEEWTTVNTTFTHGAYFQPIDAVIYPSGTNYLGRNVPLYARHRYGGAATDLDVVLGDSGTKDYSVNDVGGNTISWALGLLYAVGEAELIIPHRWELDTENMGATINCTLGSSAVIGDKPTVEATFKVDSGSGMDTAKARFTRQGSGVGAMLLTASGTAYTSFLQKSLIYAAYLFGRSKDRNQPA